MRLTFVDTGLLIAAARGKEELAAKAMNILDDPGRRFASSILVKLETIPKPAFNKRTAEKEFYDVFFATVSTWATIDEALLKLAFDEACKVGLSAMDSLHVAAARQTQSDELVTTEKETKPLHRTTLIRITTIQS